MTEKIKGTRMPDFLNGHKRLKLPKSKLGQGPKVWGAFSMTLDNKPEERRLSVSTVSCDNVSLPSIRNGFQNGIDLNQHEIDQKRKSLQESGNIVSEDSPPKQKYFNFQKLARSKTFLPQNEFFIKKSDHSSSVDLSVLTPVKDMKSLFSKSKRSVNMKTKFLPDTSFYRNDNQENIPKKQCVDFAHKMTEISFNAKRNDSCTIEGKVDRPNVRNFSLKPDFQQFLGDYKQKSRLHPISVFEKECQISDDFLVNDETIPRNFKKSVLKCDVTDVRESFSSSHFEFGEKMPDIKVCSAANSKVYDPFNDKDVKLNSSVLNATRFVRFPKPFDITEPTTSEKCNIARTNELKEWCFDGTLCAERINNNEVITKLQNLDEPIINSLSSQDEKCESSADIISNSDDGLDNNALNSQPCSINTKPTENELNTNKGSNWLHNLAPPLAVTEEVEQFGQKKSRSFVPGGFAERMWKAQRREKSNQVIWEHKFDEYIKKSDILSIQAFIESISLSGDFVVAGCHHLQPNLRRSESFFHEKSEKVGNAGSCSEKTILNHESFVVLFRKNLFTKLGLKNGKSFALYPPWQVIFSTTFSCPIIMCANFVKALELLPPVIILKTGEMTLLSRLEELAKREALAYKCFDSLKTETSMPYLRLCNLFFDWGGTISIRARIQRIWKKSVNSSLGNSQRDLLLLQDQDGLFYILFVVDNSGRLSDTWREIIKNGESHCYGFNAVHLSHKYSIRKYPELFQVINAIKDGQSNDETENTPVKICYELKSSFGVDDTPEELNHGSFLAYCAPEVLSLSTVITLDNMHRCSFLVQPIVYWDSILYITDHSLLRPGKSMHVKMFIDNMDGKHHFVTGSPLCVAEALWIKDNNYLEADDYSKIKRIDSNDFLFPEREWEEISCSTLKLAFIPLCSDSKMLDLVTVEGAISRVDESGAITWLQCSFCFQENLLQDNDFTIYCNDCSCIVPKPIINVKIEVQLDMPHLLDCVVNVQLLSSTIKNLLKIHEGNLQPKYEVADVLGIQLSPLFCIVREIDCCNKERKTFNLSEITLL